MKKVIPKHEIVILASYPPRECGIATYTKDLFTALSQDDFDYSTTISICALEKNNESRNYPREVRYTLDTSNPDAYLKFASDINKSDKIRVVLIQHEFGLFSGLHGCSLLDFLYAVKKPVWINFHTVLPAPDLQLRKTVKTIVDLCESVMVMTNNSESILITQYDIPSSKITVIPHGTHPVKLESSMNLKEKYDCKNRTIISTFGLISSNKSIETALDALPSIAKRFPDLLYLIIGKTHPEVFKNEGEVYRRSLESKVSKLGLKRNVIFINRYLELPELLELLQMTDVYLFTSRDPHQAVSGTLSFALSCGCPVVSTAIPHAVELLTEDTGILIDFNSPSKLAEALLTILEDDNLRKTMSKNALAISRASEWPNVAASHNAILQRYFPAKSIVLTLPSASSSLEYKLAN